jgi:integrase
MQRKRNSLPTGIRLRHSRSCPSRLGGKCPGRRTLDGGCEPSYEASVYDRRSGAKIRRSFAGLAQAKAWRVAAMHALHQGRMVSPARITLGELAKAFLDGASAEPPVILNRSGRPYKPSALRDIRRNLDRYILPELGSHRLADLRRADLQALANRLVGRGLSAARVRNVLNAARVVLREAVERNLIEANPATGLRLPALPEPARRAVEPGELLAFLAALPEELRPLYATAAFAGLRRGELRALRWRNVELSDGQGPLGGWIAVEASWDDVAGEVAPKSRSGRRRVPIVAPYLWQELAALRERAGGDPEARVFASRRGNPFTPSAVARRLGKHLAKVNAKRAEARLDPLPVPGLHDLRHTCGALLRAAGIPWDDICEWLGHSRGGGVTERYTSPIEVELKAAENCKRLSDYLARADSARRVEQLAASAGRGTRG